MVAEQNSRKLILRTVVKLMLMASVFAFAWVLFGSLPERGRDASEVVRISVVDLQPGDHLLVEWQKKPLYIVYRKPEWEAALLSADYDLYHDPESSQSIQSESATNVLRSPQSGWFVTLGLGTGMGCTLVFSEPDADNAGGFIDGCDQSRYDLAGRVFDGQQAQRNTVIPNWSLVDGEVLVGG